MSSIAVCLNQIDLYSIDEDKVNRRRIEYCARIFAEYRKDWISYNKSMKAGQPVAKPKFPFPAIRVYETLAGYCPIDSSGYEILFAAKRTEVTRVMVVVEAPIDYDTPISANDFFAHFKEALRQLQANDLQRSELFKTLFVFLLCDGFTDENCRRKCIRHLKELIERIEQSRT